MLGTITFAIIYSNVIRPVFTLRYIYAASVVAWMTLAIVISKLKFGRFWVMLLWVFLLVEFIPSYQMIYMNEKRANENLQTTLKATSEIGVGDIILTNHVLINGGVTRYYYPESGSQLVRLDSIPQLDESVCYYLIVSGEQDMTVAFEEVTRQGFIYTQIVDAGNLGTHTVYIYRIEK